MATEEPSQPHVMNDRRAELLATPAELALAKVWSLINAVELHQMQRGAVVQASDVMPIETIYARATDAARLLHHLEALSEAPQAAQRGGVEARGFMRGLDHVANFINSLDSADMSGKDVRTAIYSECLTARPTTPTEENGPTFADGAFDYLALRLAVSDQLSWLVKMEQRLRECWVGTGKSCEDGSASNDYRVWMNEAHNHARDLRTLLANTRAALSPDHHYLAQDGEAAVPSTDKEG